MAGSKKSGGDVVLLFEDYFPTMVEKLGAEGFVEELCKGFRVLMDQGKGVITFESLKEKAASLGLQDMTDDELRSMLKEGDSDGDGCLDQFEFCVLMLRLSPALMMHYSSKKCFAHSSISLN